PLFRQRQKAFRKKGHLGCQDRQLARACPEQSSLDANEIADIEQLVQLEISLRQLILFRINLKLAFAIGQCEESGFTEWTIRQNPSGNANLPLALRQILSRFVCVLFNYVSEGVRVP